MKRLLLMRHAKARPGPHQEHGELFSTGDEPLSKLGRQQAHRMGELIGREAPGIDALYTSPAIRCRETAQLVAEHLPEDLELVEREDLIEVPYAGPGADYHEILQTIVDTARRLRDEEDPDLPTGVSWQEATGRFADELATIVEEHENPLVVAHGAQNRAWLTTLLDMPAHHLFFLEQDHACLNIVAYGQRGHPVVQKLNVTPEPLSSESASLTESHGDPQAH